MKNNKKIIIVVAIVAVVFLIAAILIASNKKPIVVNQSSGNTLVDSYKTDLPTLEATLQKDPNNVTAIRNYAVALYATGDLESAKAQYLHEKELNPNDAVLYNNLGNIYRDSGEYQLAVDSYQKSVDLDKNQVNVYANLANLYIYTMKQPDLGYGVYTKGIENSPANKVALLLQLGNAYKDAGLKDKAIDVYNQILAVDANNVAAKAALESLKQ